MTIGFNGGLATLSEEAGPIGFRFLLMFLPFGVLPSLGVVSKRAILALALITLLFWGFVLVVGARSKGNVNFGLIFVCLLSPLLIGAIALAIDRLAKTDRDRAGGL